MSNKNKYESQKKWQEKNGLIPKTYKLDKEVVENFKKACEFNDVSQASKLTELMQNFIDKQIKNK